MIINKIIHFTLKYPKIVIAFFAFIVLMSWYSIENAHIDAIPDIGENQQVIFTDWPGRSPKDVEQQVTFPLSSLLQGIPGIDRIRGQSAFGFSVVYVIFEDDIDFYWSRSRILEKLSSIRSQLPEDATPTLGPDATGLGQIFWYTLDNTKDSDSPKSLQQLRSIQDYYVRYRLQSIKGVAEVASIGGFVKEYQVDVDPNKILAYNVHFPEIVKAIKNSNIDVGAEVIEQGDREFVVRGIGFIKKPSDIEEVVVKIIDQTPIRVKDLARVSFGPAFRRGVLDHNGSEVVGGIVTMRYGENPKNVIDNIKNEINSIQRGLPAGVTLNPFYDRSELVNATMNTVTLALVQQILIAAFIVSLFLWHFPSAFLVSLTLPIGVGVSFILMYLLNIDSNIMSLSGLVIAIGSMVDMGIIMTENIYAHLMQRKPQNLKDKVQVITDAAFEVGPAITTAIATTIITFLPIFALQAAEGKLFTPLAWAKTLAMFGAVLVAIVLIPALSIFLLKTKPKQQQKSRVGKHLVQIYRPTLYWVLHNRGPFLGLCAVVLLAGIFSYRQLGSEFMPSLNEGEILYMPVTTPDVSLSKARELLAYTDKRLKEHPLVEDVYGKLGRAESALDPAPVAMFETLIKLVDKSQWPWGVNIWDIMEQLDEHLQVPGLVNSWDFPIQTRIGMISTGFRTQVAIKILGQDLDQLQELSNSIAQELQQIPGARGVYPEKISGKPYLEIHIDRVLASRFGVNTGDINNIIQTAIGGMPISQVYEGRERYPIRVRYKKELRDSVEKLKKTLIATPSGQHVPLGQMAKLVITTGPSMIQSENGMLRSSVQLNVSGRDLIGFVEEAKARIDNNINLPPGNSLQWAGQFENQIRAKKRLAILIPISLLISFLLIYVRFKSYSLSLIVFSSIPIACAGAMILLFITSSNLSVAVWVGVIALFGIAIDDSVVMMTFLQSSIKENPPQDWQTLIDAIIRAGRRRIRPLVMTTTTTIVALFPIIWSTGQGSEIMLPMAIPILGGMGIELITLFVVPVVFSYIAQKKINEQKSIN